MYADNIQFTKVEIQLITYIFKHFKDRYNARQLARILGLNHAHVNKLCNELHKKHLLAKEYIGNSVYYTFDYSDASAMKFIEYILSLEQDAFPDRLLVLAHHLNEFNEHISLGCVFGSSIKTENYNDIDVLLVYEAKKKQAINSVKTSIRRAELLDTPIRYVEISEKDVAKNKSNEIFYNMLSESLIFHNASKYIEVISCLR